MTFGFRTRPASKTAKAGRPGSRSSTDELFEMANLYPGSTGLTRTIWVSPRGNARHGPRIQVCQIPGDRMVIDDAASVTVSDHPEVAAGPLPAAAVAEAVRWIILNKQPLLEYWEGKIDTMGLFQQLKKI